MRTVSVLPNCASPVPGGVYQASHKQAREALHHVYFTLFPPRGVIDLPSIPLSLKVLSPIASTSRPTLYVSHLIGSCSANVSTHIHAWYAECQNSSGFEKNSRGFHSTRRPYGTMVRTSRRSAQPHLTSCKQWALKRIVTNLYVLTLKLLI